MTSVSGSGVAIDATGLSMYDGAWFTARRRSKLFLMAAEVSVEPSWKLTPERVLNVEVRRSGETLHLVASAPITLVALGAHVRTPSNLSSLTTLPSTS